ncbi:MAG: M18 family aminopeptidase, partial [Bacteroidales bacterium]|nr:M18 family aminopeptidase [Bacteroidales bacterium]
MNKKLDEPQEFANDLIDFVSFSPSKYHVVRNIKAALLRKGFKELPLAEPWQIEKEGKYFVAQNDTTLAAFIVGMGQPEKDGFRIIAAHTDAPTIKVKPSPEIVVNNSYIKLNTEVYGGAILNTWFD